MNNIVLMTAKADQLSYINLHKLHSIHNDQRPWIRASIKLANELIINRGVSCTFEVVVTTDRTSNDQS